MVKIQITVKSGSTIMLGDLYWLIDNLCDILMNEMAQLVESFDCIRVKWRAYTCRRTSDSSARLPAKERFSTLSMS